MIINIERPTTAAHFVKSPFDKIYLQDFNPTQRAVIRKFYKDTVRYYQTTKLFPGHLAVIAGRLKILDGLNQYQDKKQLVESFQ